jgi:hypothetical protein
MFNDFLIMGFPQYFGLILLLFNPRFLQSAHLCDDLLLPAGFLCYLQIPVYKQKTDIPEVGNICFMGLIAFKIRNFNSEAGPFFRICLLLCGL